MCGICGVYNFGSGEPVDRDVLVRMTDALVHRGPDGRGIHVAGSLGLGNRRLSIIDISGGAMPMANEDGTIWITFNGEIYNFRELTRELRGHGHAFRTSADTEVIVHGYEQWGDDVVQRLNGIFGFGLWDGQRQRLLVARDHFGVKPIYYWQSDSRVVFGSEIKALFCDRSIVPDLDPRGLEQALAFGFIPSPNTLFRRVSKLAPGHRLIVEGGLVRTERYFNRIPRLIHDRSERDLVTELRNRLETAVERQMVSDVPIGALLSGGVDSTMIVTLMARHSDRVKTFSIGVQGAPRINELALARETAERLGTEHHEIEIDESQYFEFLQESHWYLEEPCTPSALLSYFVCKLARESVKVVLTGQGADEPFAGYARYVGESYGDVYRRLPAWVTSMAPGALSMLPGHLRLKRGAYALAEPDTVSRFNRIYEVFSAADRLALFKPEAARELADLAMDPIRGWMRGLEGLGGLDQLLYVDARCSLSDNLLMFGDKMSMAASVEARVPMLDLDLMALAEDIPADLKLRHRRPKYLLKQAAAALVPQNVVDRPKIGFAIPEEQWFRGRMGRLSEDLLLGPSAMISDYLRPEIVRGLIHTHRSARQNLWRQIFTLVSIELLLRSFMRPGARLAPAATAVPVFRAR